MSSNDTPTTTRPGGRALRPVRVTLAEQTAQILRDRIVWGELPPESWLAESELARDLGVSRTPVREALQRLEADGLLVRQGTRLLVAPFDQGVAVETLIMRELLEPFAATESVQRMSAADVKRLRGVLREMEKAGAHGRAASPRRGAQLNIEFHSLLNARCPYQRIIESIQVARDAYSALRLYTSYSADELERVHDEHVEIVEAAAAAAGSGNIAAAEHVGDLIRDHMRAARETLLRNRTHG
ncbi:GntR family transcriptional regulator [Conexibacter stalactiti]|uniref:GntR family transcriptional regulator n=1 Tax=Conexibacter stalactiti TaxID=1940611 RepID=A0ABU4HKF6_9ACTN|nr:GntR family transcriptional regulator [Conexibacter stalactiti]MDW5593030.1 GntR family transcriptional regulator [Conexibacter stalactiti]MEC5033671.1 GntR family transcriptional regulator [Conexibacter stalactiti]